MASLWGRIPSWVDWIVAVVLGTVLLNVNVTSSGDPLSGLGISAGPTSVGITDGARTMFYGVLAVGLLIVAAIGLMMATTGGRQRPVGKLLIATYPWVALAGVLGLLLDYRDGPVRTVQHLVYVMTLLGAIRLARAASLAGAPVAEVS